MRGIIENMVKAEIFITEKHLSLAINYFGIIDYFIIMINKITLKIMI